MFGKHVSEKMLREDLGNEAEICYELLSSLASLLKLGPLSSIVSLLISLSYLVVIGK